MKHIVVHRDEKSYVHNPDVQILPDGTMVMVFREAPRRRNCTHLDPESRATLLRSTDGGLTWGDPVIAAAGEGYTGIQDPSICLLRDGRLICNFFVWDAPPDAPYGAEVTGTFAVISADGGHTWDAEHIPVHLSKAPGITSATSDAVVELPNGDLLMPLYDNRGGYSSQRAFVCRSADGGRTWHEWGVMAEDPLGNVDFCEPALACLPSGKVVAMIREERKKECLWWSESLDGGQTWSTARRTPLWGFPADLLSLRSGALLCTYGYRRQPYGVRACLSHDEGKTWDLRHELIIRNDAIGPDCGYPSSVQLSDGTIFTAYYLVESAADSAGTEYSADDPAVSFAGGTARTIAASFYNEW